MDRKLPEQIHKEFYDRFAQLPLDLKAKYYLNCGIKEKPIIT